MKKWVISIFLVFLTFVLVACSQEPTIDYKEVLGKDEADQGASDILNDSASNAPDDEEPEVELVEKTTQEFGSISVTTGLSSDSSKIISISIDDENGLVVNRNADGVFSFLLGFDESDLAVESLCYSVALLFVQEKDGTMMTSSGDDVGAHTFKDGELVYGYGFNGEKYLDVSLESEVERLADILQALEYTISEIEK